MEAKFKKGDYITKSNKAAFPSIRTLRIEYFVGRNGAETTTAIAGGCTVRDLSQYREATDKEIASFKDMEKKAYDKAGMLSTDNLSSICQH